ncbi:MAG: hypothetical protein V1816_01440 [Pseudomonadota bacterium]
MKKTRRYQKTINIWVLLFLVVPLIGAGCGGGPDDPIDEIRTSLRGAPSYSIVLDDMKEEGNFITEYFHKYKIIAPEKTATTDWRPVSEEMYQQYLPFLGMTIFTKKDGVETAEASPPGYAYVGDNRYGSWQTNSSGQSFWSFYGQYRLLSDLLGGHTINRNSWDNYRTQTSTGRPYYGDNKEYGTQGSHTKQTKPDFYSRKMSSVNQAKQSFGGLVNQKIGRTRVSSRGRGGGAGK